MKFQYVQSISKSEPAESAVSNEESPAKKKDSSEWYDVGIIRGTNCTVNSYFIPPEGYDENTPILEFLTGVDPDFSKHLKVNLEPGTAYKFRIAAINSRGQGPWSEVSFESQFHNANLFS